LRKPAHAYNKDTGNANFSTDIDEKADVIPSRELKVAPTQVSNKIEVVTF